MNSQPLKTTARRATPGKARMALAIGALATLCLGANMATANPVLIASQAMPECNKQVENSNAFRLSVRKKGPKAISLRFKKNKSNKVKSSVYRKATADFKACMVQKLEPHAIEVK